MRHPLLALSALFLTPLAAAAQSAAPTDNPEMARLFAEDQAVRTNITPAQMRDIPFVRKMLADDAARRIRTRTLLDTGKLSTGEDYYAAAFVFQHGGKPEDYLLAHSLALAAVARGKAGASWIAAATLDRYLQVIGQKQIYGTQSRQMNGQPPTRDPYDRALVPDSLRTALGVPVLAEQDADLLEMQAERVAPR
ncbi:hypothetical protein [Sphingomonas sp. Leaf25]|uniref:hypothetical protein n=1 Tax=Sphingomonas sp. Leaf25 TaxID=1735692 RepID=UPI0006F2365D|nr:hypothetical protein [Sphingomonas sp. Leaf25]KQM96843.1 hypothetical protein ASE78_12940 [Sphingomonas sp. Leaf25]